jgi:hypothetical protein
MGPPDVIDPSRKQHLGVTAAPEKRLAVTLWCRRSSTTIN